jgi:transcriptional regulator with XRE-family HTH domain
MTDLDRNIVRDFGRVRARILRDGKFNDLLRHDLRQTGENNSALAKLIGTSRASFHKWINGDVVPSIEFLANIADLVYPDMADDVIVQYVRKIQSERVQ